MLVPRTEKSGRFTIMFVIFAIDVLLATRTVAGACSLLRTSWDEAWSILEKAMERGTARRVNAPMPRIEIDEHSFPKGYNYMTLIYDLDRSTVEAIAMDTSAAYVRSAKENIPPAEEKGVFTIAFTS